jgi:trimeric autotransporter adhesin
MKRLTTTLAATVAALAASAGTAFAAGPVQSGTQSSSTTQGAVATSSVTQIQPTNENISVRVLSPGNDGSVSQSNKASSSADATNTASTSQTASQTGAGCGCIKSGKLDDVLGTAMQAAAPAGGVQSTTQNADTTQVAAAGSSTEQVRPTNTNISVRVLSDGDNGNVTQSNEASSSADATNSAPTTQSSSQTGAGAGGVQATTQDAETTQGSLAESSAKQVHPENTNTPVRVGSTGGGGSVSQSNEAQSSANAKNTAPVGQSATQNESAGRCGCDSGGPAVQVAGQSSEIAQGAKAASSAEQIATANTNEPVRVWSDGNDGRVHQSNDVSSDASAENTAPVTQTSTQQQADGPCGCSKDPAVQALGQSSEIGQLAIGLSSAEQAGAANDSAPVRVYSNGGGGSVSQSNEAESSADASNHAPVSQTGRQAQSGSGVQALGQDSSIGQIALAGSSTEQLPGRSECGCGHSFGNSADPVRVWSDGNDGSLRQENKASSEATAENTAAPTQTGTQTQTSPSCGCGSLGIQALGQYATVDQLAVALSSTHQIGAKNSSGPVRVKSTGGGGSTRQSNDATSSSSAPNVARILQTGHQMMV